MSYRFTDTEKWSDPWFRKLPAEQKLVFIYMCDRCDCAGFLEMDEELMAFLTGVDSDACLGATKGLARAYLEKDGIYWVKNFLKHQKNLPLNPANNAHKAVIASINQRLGLFPSIPQILGANKGLFSPIGKGKGRGNGKKEDLRAVDFPSFWEAYPKKTGHKPCETKWAARNLDEIAEKIIAHVKTMSQTDDWTKEDGKYVPNPLTYINQNRWEDKPPQINTTDAYLRQRAEEQRKESEGKCLI